MTVAYAFDTLGYSKRLREAGVSNDQAEAHAEAAREFIMTELVNRQDLLATKLDLQAEIGTLRTDVGILRTDVGSLRTELRSEAGTLRTAINALEARIDTQTLRLTVRLGGMVVAGIGALALLQRLH
jgi:Protein of unknown function (DUF1640)